MVKFISVHFLTTPELNNFYDLDMEVFLGMILLELRTHIFVSYKRKSADFKSEDITKTDQFAQEVYKIFGEFSIKTRIILKKNLILNEPVNFN